MNSFPKLKPGDFVLVDRECFGQVVTVFKEPIHYGATVYTIVARKDSMYKHFLPLGPVAIHKYSDVEILPVTKELCMAGRKALILHLAFSGVDVSDWVWREKEEPKKEDG